jgi:hypothetical protein
VIYALSVPVLPTVVGNTPCIRDGFPLPIRAIRKPGLRISGITFRLRFTLPGSGNVYYDSVTLDGKTTQFYGMYGNSSRSGPWAQGVLSLNFQLDGINHGEKETTITAYTDGFTMIYW